MTISLRYIIIEYIRKVIIRKSGLERKSFENFLKVDNNLKKEIGRDNFFISNVADEIRLTKIKIWAGDYLDLVFTKLQY